MKSAILCGHANESPGQPTCPCPGDCYCKVQGGCLSGALAARQRVRSHFMTRPDRFSRILKDDDDA